MNRTSECNQKGCLNFPIACSPSGYQGQKYSFFDTRQLCLAAQNNLGRSAGVTGKI
jgi:hypothetical protein